jgi:hypothetical protein
MMPWWLGLGGLGLDLAGALLVALGDAWFSRSVLIYLDAVEANLTKLAKALEAGGGSHTLTPPDVKRDRGQNRARAWKSVGWCLLIAGLLAQTAALCLALVAV